MPPTLLTAYQNELSYREEGIPLWEADPGHEYPEVEIGDVGYIL